MDLNQLGGTRCFWVAANNRYGPGVCMVSRKHVLIFSISHDASLFWPPDSRFSVSAKGHQLILSFCIQIKTPIITVIITQIHNYNPNFIRLLRDSIHPATTTPPWRTIAITWVPPLCPVASTTTTCPPALSWPLLLPNGMTFANNRVNKECAPDKTV